MSIAKVCKAKPKSGSMMKSPHRHPSSPCFEGAEGGEGTGEGTGEGAAQGAPPVEGGEVEELFALPLFRKPAFPGWLGVRDITFKS